MKHLGSLKGNGDILVDGTTVAAAGYDIDIWEEANGRRAARGQLDGDFFKLHKAFDAGSARLELETGGEVTIIITRLATDGGSEFQVSGPVPGF